MGYDITFHSISEEQIKEWYFDVLDDHKKARELAKKHKIDKDADNFYENKYIEILELGKSYTKEDIFDKSHGYCIANMQGVFQEYFYLRGRAFSFIDDPIMDKYYSNWEDIIPKEYQNYRFSNTIDENYCSGSFIPYEKVCKLLEDYENDEKVERLLDKEFDDIGIEVILEALRFSKEKKVGLLEADGVMEPNPTNLNDSTCYSNIFNCDLQGPLLYQDEANNQIEMFLHDIDKEDDDKLDIDKMLEDSEEMTEEINSDLYESYNQVKSHMKSWSIKSILYILSTIGVYFIWGDKWYFWFLFALSIFGIFMSIFIFFNLKKIGKTLEDKIENDKKIDEFINSGDALEYEEIVNQKCDEIEDMLKPYEKDYIFTHATTKEVKQPWSSKFGGKPYWEKGVEYPKNRDGKPLYMIAQLNFSEMPKIEEYPSEGILQFFIANDDTQGCNFDENYEEVIKNPQGYRVVFHESVIKDESLLDQDTPNIKDVNMPVDREYALELYSMKDLPKGDSCIFDKIVDMEIYKKEDYKDELYDEINNRFSSGGSKLGGYAYFTQEDPRFGEDCDKWQLLFQLASTSYKDIDIMWGDLGVAHFFIEKDRLLKRDFSQVWYHWDCH